MSMKLKVGDILPSAPMVPPLSLEPVFEFEAANALKFAHIVSHKCQVECTSMCGDQQIVQADGLSCSFQGGANVAVFDIGGDIQRQNWERFEYAFDLGQ